MKLRGRVFSLAGLAAFFLSAACATPVQSVEVGASPASIKQSLGRGHVRYLMADESWIFVESPRDFGSAICGRNICLNKAEIRGLQYNEGGGGIMVDQPWMAPFVTIAMFGMIQPTVGGGAKSAAPTVADLMPECAANTNPSPSSDALASREALADWAWRNHDTVRSGCLQRASIEFKGRDVRKAIELEMLGVAKGQWDQARCKDARLGSYRVLPVLSAGEDDGLKTGDVALLRRAQEIVADPMTYSDTFSTQACANSELISDKLELEERRRLLAARLDPFSREPFVSFGKAVETTVRNPDAISNRRGPTILIE